MPGLGRGGVQPFKDGGLFDYCIAYPRVVKGGQFCPHEMLLAMSGDVSGCHNLVGQGACCHLMGKGQ